MSRRTPFDELDRLFEQMQENFEDAAELWDPDAVDAGLPTTTGLRIDLEDTGEELVLTGDLPGFDADDIDVRVNDRTLHVSAERDDATETDGDEFVRRERHHSSVSRSVSLPAPVDTEGIDATHNNGVLTVRMPKVDPDSDGTRIDVT